MTSTKLFRPVWRKLLCLSLIVVCWISVYSQRTYKPSSVLATGNWYKISVTSEGVYKLDVPFLSSLGLSGNIPSSQIRIFGHSGGMLPEANAASRIDDLEELAIAVEDGGDGQLNGNDYILLYSQGPNKWLKDSLNRRFVHQKNLYSDRAYYFITVGGPGKRITNQTSSPAASVTVNSFDDRYFYEKDTINFLSSGKEWLGEEFSSLPGRSLTRSFAIPFSSILPGQATIQTSVVARSVNSSSRFNVSVSNQPVQQLLVPAITTGQYDLFVREAIQTDNFIINNSTKCILNSHQCQSTQSQSVKGS